MKTSFSQDTHWCFFEVSKLSLASWHLDIYLLFQGKLIEKWKLPFNNWKMATFWTLTNLVWHQAIEIKTILTKLIDSLLRVMVQDLACWWFLLPLAFISKDHKECLREEYLNITSLERRANSGCMRLLLILNLFLLPSPDESVLLPFLM